MGKLLDWDNMPPVGTSVVFKGYRNGDHSHWGFEVGKTYTIGQDMHGDIGPMAGFGGAPQENYGGDFIFELAEFTKSDLKDGMRVELDSTRLVFYVCGGKLNATFPYGNHWWEICNLDDNLQSSKTGAKVMRVTDRDGTVLFEREEEPRELTIEEIAEAFNLPVEHVRIKK